MHVLCVVEESLAGRHVATIASDIGRRLRAELTVVTAGSAQPDEGVSGRHYDLLVVGPPQPYPLGGLPPWGARNRAIKRARAPVMIVSDAAAVRRYDRVMLAYEPSQAAAGAVATAAQLAMRLGATLCVVLPIAGHRRHAYPKWHLERAVSREIDAAMSHGHRLDVEFSRRIGRPARELARAAAQIKPVFVVVAADARPAWRSVSARVAKDVLGRGSHPVVIVPAAPQMPALAEELSMAA